MRELWIALTQQPRTSQLTWMENCVHFETWLLHSFLSQVMEVTRRMNKSILRTLRSIKAIRMNFKKQLIVARMEKNNGSRGSNLKKGAYRKRIEAWNFHHLPSFPCGERNAVALSQLWIKYRVIQLLDVESISLVEDMKHPKYAYPIRR